MVARLDDFDGFLSRNCLILFLHVYKLLFPKVVIHGVGQVFWLVQIRGVFPITNISDMMQRTIAELTATGIAPDFHRIPY